MKCLFLDIDGVINHNSWYNSDAYYQNEFKDPDLDPNVIERLNRVTDKHNIKIVISSSWKLDSYCIPRLQNAGLKNIIGQTPDFIFRVPVELYCRGLEIQAYLDKHLEIDNYLILDDESDFLENQMKYFYKIDYQVGLTDIDAIFIDKWFNKDDNCK